MKRARTAGLWILLLVGSLGCEREQERPRKRPFPPTAASGEELDGMQLAAGRRVALESAVAAMQRRDLHRLKQLSVWVRHRATVPLFEPADLEALDIAIECLEHGATPSQQLARLERLETGKLVEPARAVCRGDLQQ